MSPELYAVALRLLRRPELAQDAVHDAFVQIWERAASFDSARGSARGWLIAIVRYRSLDMLRRLGRRQDDLDVDEIVLADPDADPSERLGLSEDAARLRRCLDGLSLQARQCILLAHVRGYTHDELAVRLERPVGTVKSWIRRGLAMLRICLDS